MPCPDDKEIYAIWFMNGNEYRSAKIENSLEGEERKALWDQQIQELERKEWED